MNIIAEYIQQASINISALEKKAGLPANTLQNYFNATQRKPRVGIWWATMVALCPVAIGNHTYRFYPENDMFIAECPAGEDEPYVAPHDKGNYFVYYPATYRSIIDDDPSFKDWFNIE